MFETLLSPHEAELERAEAEPQAAARTTARSAVTMSPKSRPPS
jgi:hypothetical protein